MQDIYSRLSEEEQRILSIYHQRDKQKPSGDSENKLKSQENSETQSNQNISFRSEAPLKVLQTKIFNESQPILHPQKPRVIITQKPRSASTPKEKKIPSKQKLRLNSSKLSTKAKNSSRNSSTTKLKKKSVNTSSLARKSLDFCRLPN